MFEAMPQFWMGWGWDISGLYVLPISFPNYQQGWRFALIYLRDGNAHFQKNIDTVAIFSLAGKNFFSTVWGLGTPIHRKCLNFSNL